MNSGLPPTAPNARAGLFIPPGITRHARANAAAVRGRGWDDGCGPLILRTPESLRDRVEELLGTSDKLLDLLGLVLPVQVNDVAAAVADGSALDEGLVVAPDGGPGCFQPGQH